ncbi:MAG: hypothetical protein QOC92_1316, partial [Acidimicrobiaceae bacterium]
PEVSPDVSVAFGSVDVSPDVSVVSPEVSVAFGSVDVSPEVSVRPVQSVTVAVSPLVSVVSPLVSVVSPEVSVVSALGSAAWRIEVRASDVAGIADRPATAARTASMVSSRRNDMAAFTSAPDVQTLSVYRLIRP